MTGAQITASRGGKQLDVDAANVPVIDDVSLPTSAELAATVSFHLTWKANARRRKLGHPHSAAPTDPDAFLARLAHAMATGAFSGSETGFVFQGNGKSTFAELGTERNGVFLTSPVAVTCQVCAGRSTAAASR